MAEARSWSNTSPCAADSRPDMAAGFAWGWGISSYRGIDVRWSSLVTRETSRGAPPHGPFDENNHQLGPGAST